MFFASKITIKNQHKGITIDGKSKTLSIDSELTRKNLTLLKISPSLRKINKLHICYYLN